MMKQINREAHIRFESMRKEVEQVISDIFKAERFPAITTPEP